MIFLKLIPKTVWVILTNLPKIIWHLMLIVVSVCFYGTLVGALWVTTKLESYFAKKVEGA